MLKSELTSKLLDQQTQNPPISSPMISKVIQYHQKNQETELKAQEANSKIIKEYEQRKKKFDEKSKNKTQEIMERLSEERKRKVRAMKKKSEHVQKVMEKFIKLDEQKFKDKIQRINKRNYTLHKATLERNQDSLDKESTHRVESIYMTNSLDLNAFHDKNFQKTLQMCKQIMNRSLEKQKKADENRKIQNQNSRIKQLNQTKYVKQLKAAQYIENKQNAFLRKSVARLQLLQRRCEEHMNSERKKIKDKRQTQEKNAEKIKKKRKALQTDLQQKYAKFQRIMRQKSQKVERNKENLKQSFVQNKKRKRLEHEHQNQEKYMRNQHFYTTKMSEMYKKDRQHWGFLTAVGHFKDILIEKNIYENNHLALLK